MVAQLKDKKQYISGSPQWTEGGALQQLRRGEPDSTAALAVRQAGTEKTCEMTRPDRRIRALDASA
ncbi:hypothetical protein [Salinibacter altiplanensis]|uniref:hypothetical protein n=1 Tax=Salinibacter altiplanensis TaxID=1803181 RepID=UPI001F1B1F45|nr:hypothetical protein [Salinibacter altiplanensis]